MLADTTGNAKKCVHSCFTYVNTGHVFPLLNKAIAVEVCDARNDAITTNCPATKYKNRKRKVTSKTYTFSFHKRNTYCRCLLSTIASYMADDTDSVQGCYNNILPINICTIERLCSQGVNIRKLCSACLPRSQQIITSALVDFNIVFIIDQLPAGIP